MGCTTSSLTLQKEDLSYAPINYRKFENKKCIIYEVYISPRLNHIGANRRKINPIYPPDGNMNPPWKYSYDITIGELLRSFGYYLECSTLLRCYERLSPIMVGEYVFYILYQVE